MSLRPKTCIYSGCRELYVPVNGKQRYCSKECVAAAYVQNQKEETYTMNGVVYFNADYYLKNIVTI